MFSADGILGRDFSIMAAGMDGLAMRQQVHAENVANIDTPNYQARTVDFESTLRGAIDAGRSGNPMAADGAQLSSSVADSVTAGELTSKFAVEGRPGAPGGRVDRTQEVSSMMNDNIRFRVLSQQVTNRISGLRSVISEMGRG